MLQYRFATSCAALCLAFLAACDSAEPTFQDVSGGQASGALRGGASNAGPRGNDVAPAVDAGASTDPVVLPPDVSLDPSGVLFCGDAPCQCNNGIDDDGDGTADGFDIECTGGIDDDESSFATGIPGDNRDPKWQDCFFDGNSGAGDDRCRYPTECLTGELSLDDEACAVTQACRDNCQPRTPKGCDCFGCCEIELPGGTRVNVTLADTCSAEKIGDPAACAPCSPNPTCGYDPAPSGPDAGVPPVDPGNPEPEPTDPEPTDPEPPANDCGERNECSEGVSCAVGEFCSFGCCLVVIR
jgi:hypothetical protein